MKEIVEKMQLKKYSSYKDSGVEWLGEIPEHWEILSAKRFHEIVKEPNSRKKCDNILSLTLRGVVNNDPDSPEGLVPKDYSTYQIFEKDNLVFKLIDLENVKTSRVGIVHEKGIMSSAYIRLIVGCDNFPRYTYYYYYSLYINEVYNNVGSGVRATLGPNDLLNLPYIKPTLEEQTRIANFLDKKTQQIDQAIGIKEKQISLLKERRQILIHNAVTRGLDPDVKLKDSGVEWIGKIPEHWQVKRAKFLFDEIGERSKTGEEELLSVSHMTGVTPRSEKNVTMFKSEDYTDSKLCIKDDLIFNIMWAWMGALGVSDRTGIVSPSYAVYRQKNLNTFNTWYLEQLLRDINYVAHYNRVSTGLHSSRLRFYSNMFFDMKIGFPPREEQDKIVDFLKSSTQKIDQAILSKEKEIEKLKEYKATLINSTVTGKIKVF